MKNWQALLRVVAQINSDKPWKLSLCGKDDDDEVKDLIDELGLSSSVEMLGYREDVYSLMLVSDLLVLPSWAE